MLHWLEHLDNRLPVSVYDRLNDFQPLFLPLPPQEWPWAFAEARSEACKSLEILEPDIYRDIADPAKMDRVIRELRFQCDISVRVRALRNVQDEAIITHVAGYLENQSENIAISLIFQPSRDEITIAILEAQQRIIGTDEIGLEQIPQEKLPEFYDCITACLYTQQQYMLLADALEQKDTNSVDLLINGRPYQLGQPTSGPNL